MKKRFLIPALIALSSTSALAGYKLTANVVVQANGIAYGSMGSARNSADTMQFIGCEIYATTSYSNLSCRARSSAGTELNCWQDARAFDDMRQAVTAMTDGSWIRFDVNPASDTPTKCTFVHVNNASKYAPPQL